MPESYSPRLTDTPDSHDGSYYYDGQMPSNYAGLEQARSDLLATLMVKQPDGQPEFSFTSKEPIDGYDTGWGGDITASLIADGVDPNKSRIEVIGALSKKGRIRRVVSQDGKFSLDEGTTSAISKKDATLIDANDLSKQEIEKIEDLMHEAMLRFYV